MIVIVIMINYDYDLLGGNGIFDFVNVWGLGLRRFDMECSNMQQVQFMEAILKVWEGSTLAAGNSPLRGHVTAKYTGRTWWRWQEIIAFE